MKTYFFTDKPKNGQKMATFFEIGHEMANLATQIWQNKAEHLKKLRKKHISSGIFWYLKSQTR